MKCRWRKTVRWFAAAVVLIVGGLGIYTWKHWSAAAPFYPSSEGMSSIELPLRLRSDTEHGPALQRIGGNPYILEIQPADQGAILYYGASHSRAPHHPQVADIETRWRAFNPTVALSEGRARGYFYGALIEPLAGLSEPALVHKLARRDKVRLYSLEPAYHDEVAQLLAKFKPEQVALYFFLRVYLLRLEALQTTSLRLISWLNAPMSKACVVACRPLLRLIQFGSATSREKKTGER